MVQVELDKEMDECVDEGTGWGVKREMGEGRCG